MRYTAPTKVEYWECLLTIPTIEDADMWSRIRLGGGPMNVNEFTSHAHICGIDEAHQVNRLRSLTVFGWYISLWIDFFRRLLFYSYKQYKHDHYYDYLSSSDTLDDEFEYGDGQ